MRILLGIFLILLGIFLGIYVGIIVLFVGGIENIINGFISTPIDARLVAWGLAMLLVDGFVGWLIVVVFFGIGWTILSNEL